MIFRVYKLMPFADQIGRFLEAFRDSLTRFFHHRTGNRGTYLFEDLGNPHQYFILTYWDDLTCLNQAIQHETYAELRSRLHAVLVERHRHYHLERTRHDRQPFKPIDPALGAARLVLVVEPPGELGVLADLFDGFADEYARDQPGCRCIDLYRQMDTPNRVWVFGLYKTRDDLEAWLHHPLIFEVREDAQALSYERMQSWNMQLRIDDPHYPLSAAEASA